MITIEEFKKKQSETCRLIGLDLGSKRIGVSICDEKQSIATPLKTLNKTSADNLINELKIIIEENSIKGIIIGYPINMDGTLGRSAQSVHDVLTVLKEEAEEDALRLAGVGDEEITDGVITKTKRRFNWLLLNLFTAFLATWCISLFGATIEQMVVLAFLMPIVASMGGNAGMQTLAVTVRTIATNDLTKNNFSSNVFKEFSIGILNGVIFAVISALIVQIWFQDNLLSLIIAISMVLTMIIAGLFGILVPFTLKKMNIDPAIASSVFVTTITDVIGFVSFLGVGAYFL